MYPYIANIDQDKEEMLKIIGVKTMQDLFKDIPENVLLNKELQIEKSSSEIEVSNKVSELARKNKSIDDYICFLGAGAYDHYIPAVIKHLVSRSEFYTAYTPYQPEISQGTLQGVFEFQSMICELTGLDVANASMYDGPTAAAEAAILTSVSTRRKKVLVSKTVNPETRKVLDTYLKFRDVEYVEIEEKDGTTDIESLKGLMDKDTAGVLIQSPNFFGIIEDVSEAEKIIHDNKSLFIMSVDPISLGILKSPGKLGADIAVGEGQALGQNINFGGPCVGFMTATSKLMRKLPGRIVGQTEDVDGKRGFVLTLQAREQHIRREKATSNICSDQTLNAISAAIYMSTLGKQGIKEVAEQCIKKSHYAYNKLIESGKVKPLFKDKPFFKEFAVALDKDVDKANEGLEDKGILGGYNITKNYENHKNSMLLCVTEKRSKSDIDKLVKVMEVI
ncbi:aminomethyl-transferring glycine dehydrogenase subunit GcvPA [Clostridium algidicarnis]|uniref:aminomethyl-transferring glycine dehydrogenase subunit GcvPA n=1 Tax=Clostridium algidicarnis TaxID=37659 RepID=UPI000496CD58|nr:aminomethyl-transferring glycine dehydrogenase subunit GcvPA [Clostridium algidicarnis]